VHGIDMTPWKSVGSRLSQKGDEDVSYSRKNSKWHKGRTHTWDNEQFNIWTSKKIRNKRNWNIKLEWGRSWLNTTFKIGNLQGWVQKNPPLEKASQDKNKIKE